ncbi:serine acetyltransferase [Shewanella bicestrii]
MSIRYFKEDLAFSAQTNRSIIILKHALVSHTIHLTFLFRAGQSLSNIPYLGVVARIIIEYLIRVIYSSDISCRAKIGPGLSIVHGHDIVIGADVVIGRNTKIFNGVTFGNKDISQTSFGNQPTVGDGCIFCTGAKVLGPVKIGNNVIVGANSVLLQDCDDHDIVAGVPAKFIKKLKL